MSGNVEAYYEAKNEVWMNGFRSGQKKLKEEIERELSGQNSLIEMIVNIQEILREVK